MMQVDSTAWSEALAAARKCGWRPAGTQAPARVFDLDIDSSVRMPWNDCYERPEGQTVCHGDAQSLARAIDKASAEMAPGETANALGTLAIAQFCAMGSFLICAAPAVDLPDCHKESTQSLLRLNAAFDLPVSPARAMGEEPERIHEALDTVPARNPLSF